MAPYELSGGIRVDASLSRDDIIRLLSELGADRHDQGFTGEIVLAGGRLCF